jgi:hypothetical protein
VNTNYDWQLMYFLLPQMLIFVGDMAYILRGCVHMHMSMGGHNRIRKVVISMGMS